MSSKAIFKSKLSVKYQTITAFLTVIAAVALPQLFHTIGSITGAGSSLGEIFLPMHLPVILAGFAAGPFAAGIAGVLSPLVSFMLTGMPMVGMLPFMMIELCVYGIAAGMLRNVNIPAVAKVAITQIAGRAVRAAAILTAVYAFDYTGVKVSVITTSIATGAFGIILQLVLIPVISKKINGIGNEQ